jgi:transposase-like protein
MSDALEVVQSGSFCWNEQCSRYGEVGAGNMRRFGKTAAGVQRFQCRLCRKVFTATRGTPFYGIHDPEKMLRALALLAERVSIRGVGRATGAKPDAVTEWMEKAAGHVGLIEKMLQQRHQVTRAQLDALWAFVGHKGEKGGERRKRSGAASGVPG